MIRKIALGVSALALTVGGLAMTAGPAFAGKPTLSGHLTCNTSSNTTFSPSLMLAVPAKHGKPGVDKGSKITTHTVLSGCTGAETNGLIPPTGGTTDTKTKALSRLCQNQGSVPPGKTKTALTGGSGGKFKESGGSTTTFLDSGTPLVHGDDVPLPTSVGDLLAALQGPHANDQLYILGVGGHSTGKSYANKALSSVSHSPGILAKFNSCTSAIGLAAIHTTGVTNIG